MKWAAFFLLIVSFTTSHAQTSWVRINQLGYPPHSKKIAVWCSKEKQAIANFQLIDSAANKIVLTKAASKPFGAYGPFAQSQRLDFSTYNKNGTFYIKAGSVRSPYFKINADVYNGTADFCLRYMRQQRSGFNPFLKDSCHTHDGYTLYGEEAGIKDSTYLDVVGGWHDASDYLQYATTSANATYHLLMAYRDFKNVFGDQKTANGLEGKNEQADVLDEAKWGLDWLLKMHPQPDVMFNQIADDRDHQGMRIPKQDSFYGRGYMRPVYFINGKPQQRGKFLNNTNGTSSTAAKFASVFSLGAVLFNENKSYAGVLREKAFSALQYAYKKTGVTQTASVKSPYIYAEENWTDDLELAEITITSLFKNQNLSDLTSIPAEQDVLKNAFSLAQQEPITPWLGADTAKHYQWYPFINIGHYELAKVLKDKRKDTIISYYRQGIQKVLDKATRNAFSRGIPSIWCSNNLTTSFAIQCYWYRQLTGDRQFEELEQANFDWLFGLNPWGTSMVYGLPSWGDTPTDPHSAFTHLKNYPIDGGLVDGPVYGSIYKNLIGIKLYQPDEYAPFQSDLAVYHDDYGDYSTNEPTMDGTASLIYLLAAKESETKNSSSIAIKQKSFRAQKSNENFIIDKYGAITRGDTSQKKIAIVFTGHEYGEGGPAIAKFLKHHKIKASFFLTGKFYHNPLFRSFVQSLKKEGHYLGAHSDAHLLYAGWASRDSLLVTKHEFHIDLARNYEKMKEFGIDKHQATYFLPPYEWYNDSIVAWTREACLQLINYTAGTLSHTDYTTTKNKNYRSSEAIWQSIMDLEKQNPSLLNGFILLFHVGAGKGRKDKFYLRLPQLLSWLKLQGYQPVRIDELLFGGVQD